MANELQFYGLIAQTGLALVARVYTDLGAQVGADVSCSEVGTSSIYIGDMPSTGAGTYAVRFVSSGEVVGSGIIEWDGTQEVTGNDIIARIAGLNDFDPAADLVTTDTASREASKADVSGLSTFDASSDTVVASNMRGTDGANTTTPDNAGIASIFAATDELQQNQGDWATAVGFATPADVAAQTVELKGLEDKDLTEVFNNTPSIDPSSVWTHSSRTLTAGTRDAEIDAVKASTDNLPADPASATNITAQTVDIKGPDDRDLTEVYNNAPSVSIDPQDVADAMKLTPGAGAPAAGSVQTRLQTIEGGMGDDVNVVSVGGAAVAGPSDLKAELSGLALESTVQLIKVSTDSLPVDPASESTLVAGRNSVLAAIGGLDDLTAQEVWEYAARGLTEPIDLQAATQAAIDLMRRLAECDQVYDDSTGMLHYYDRSTTIDVIPPKDVGGTNVQQSTRIQESP